MKKGYYLITITGIMFGTIIFGGAVFAEMGLSLFEIGVFRTIFALVFLPYLFYKKEYRLNFKSFKLYSIYGFILSLSMLAGFVPIVLGVPVALIVLLIYTAPLWTVVLSKFIFGEIITWQKVIAIILVLLGIVILVNPFKINVGANMIGMAIALASGLFLSLWGIYGKLCGNENLHPVKTQFYEATFALVCMALYYPGVQLFINDNRIIGFTFLHSPIIWLYLLGFSLISFIIPQTLYFYGIKNVQASTAGIILLLEPLSAAILATLFLAQAITWNVFLGGLFIIVANYLVIKSENNQKLPEAEVKAMV